MNTFFTIVSPRRCILDGEEDNNVITQPIVNQGFQGARLIIGKPFLFYWKADGEEGGRYTYNSSLGH